MFGQVFAVGDDETGLALLRHLQGEVIGVEVLAFQGEENSVFFNLAAVGGDFVSLEVMLIYCFYHLLWVWALRPFDELRAQGPLCFNERSRLTDQTASKLS